MYRKQIYFPDDWIKPGEFNFCNSCGYHVSLSTPYLCPGCKETIADMSAWEESTARFRRNLAEIRRKTGLPSLFWMNK